MNVSKQLAKMLSALPPHNQIRNAHDTENKND